jgi:acid phosphatase family membrane protein YuiD
LLAGFFQNSVLLCAIISWFVAQVLKVFIYWRIERRFDVRKLISNGGMPSAHTAFVISLAVMIAFKEGVSSTLFALAFALAAVVINDAVGVRYHTGEQSKIINKILRQMLIEGKPLTDETLHELVGHTPTEAFFGALLGLIVPLFF